MHGDYDAKMRKMGYPKMMGYPESDASYTKDENYTKTEDKISSLKTADKGKPVFEKKSQPIS